VLILFVFSMTESSEVNQPGNKMGESRIHEEGQDLSHWTVRIRPSSYPRLAHLVPAGLPHYSPVILKTNRMSTGSGVTGRRPLKFLSEAPHCAFKSGDVAVETPYPSLYFLSSLFHFSQPLRMIPRVTTPRDRRAAPLRVSACRVSLPEMPLLRSQAPIKRKTAPKMNADDVSHGFPFQFRAGYWVNFDWPRRA